MGALDCVANNKISPRDSGVFTVNMNSQTSLNANQNDLESQSLKQGLKRNTCCWRLFTDGPLLLLVLVLVGLFETGWIPNYKSGFYCNDPALSHPFTGDTVSFGVIVSTILFCPLVLVFITEYTFHKSTYSKQSRLRCCIRNTLDIYRSYAYGLFFNFGTVEVMKGLMGNPRPTFFDLCEPDTGKTCNGSEYVSSFECTSTKYSKWYQNDSYRSFPSGHTSLSIYCGLFMAWYLQKRAFDWQHRTVLLVPVVQMTCVTYAAICSLTRITDHRHHWWDVLTGAGIGAATLFYTVLVLCNNFETLSSSDNKGMTDSRQTVQTVVFEDQLQAQRSTL